MVKYLIITFCFAYFFTANSLAQEKGWGKFYGISGKSFENRFHYGTSGRSHLTKLKELKMPFKIIVYPYAVNTEVKNILPNYKNILVQKFLDNEFGVTGSSDSSTDVVLDIKTFKYDDLIAFNIRLYVAGGGYLEKNEMLSYVPSILWENILFGYVKKNEVNKIPIYINEVIDELMHDLSY